MAAGSCRDRLAQIKVTGAFAVKGFANQDRAYELTSGDFNGDGFPDVAFPAWNHGAIGVMLTLPNGDLAAPSFYPATVTADSIASGDFNRDGILDLVASSESSNLLGVVFGNGDGTFGSLLTLFASANGTSKVTVGDFDGSGFDDIAVAAASGSNVDIFYNASVPEPTCVAFLLLAGAAGIARPRRRSCRR